MRDYKTGNYIMVDKSILQFLKGIKREYSKAEALLSLQIDIDCGCKWSYSGYSKLWGWSRNKVRSFVGNLLSEDGQKTARRGTPLRHPIHVISRANPKQKDSRRPVNGHIADTTSNPNPNPKRKDLNESKTIRPTYSQEFESFWNEYPNKKGKHKAYESWKRFKCGNGLFTEIMSSLKKQKNSDEWARDGGKYIPHGSTWVNGKMWEDSYCEEKIFVSVEEARKIDAEIRKQFGVA